MTIFTKHDLVAYFCCGFLLVSLGVNAQGPLPLDRAIQLTLANDPWLKANELQESALIEQSKASDYFPDPTVSLGVLNLPTDGFAFDQEPMTQIRIGLTQMLPRGDALALSKRQLQEQAMQLPFQRLNRKAQLTQHTSALWLNAISAKQEMALLEQSKEQVLQLLEVVEVNYASGRANTKQQDIISAQLAIEKLENQLSATRGEYRQAMASLVQNIRSTDQLAAIDDYQISEVFPQHTIKLVDSDMRIALQKQLIMDLPKHPAIAEFDMAIAAAKTRVDLKEQDYAPQWGLNTSYGYRQDDQLGQSRADFFSVGVSVSVPLFTQDKVKSQVRAAQLMVENLRTQKRLKLQSMLVNARALIEQALQISERIRHFDRAIQLKLQQRTEATLSSFTNNEGAFDKVMQARIAEADGAIERLKLLSQLSKTHIQLAYYQAQSSSQGDRP